MTDRRALRRLSYGMYVISAKHGDRINGQLSNTVFQVSSDPPVISVSINKMNTTHDMIAKSQAFAVSVLDVTAPLTLISVFGFKHGREVDKYLGIAYRAGKNGAPILAEHTTAFLEASVIGSVDAETHTLFLGVVSATGCLGEGEPMTYDYYHRVLRGAPQRPRRPTRDRTPGKVRHEMLPPPPQGRLRRGRHRASARGSDEGRSHYPRDDGSGLH